ncbi:VTT domain-containing protein [Myxococcota bacterium]|nr:VTT domain-containing protein [Myxococcota bacterium]MBU1410604.1 VTT domain-containing protein [Myxococcota bacterium]MBU1511305.1 VTT domain-containing protein [Myxococcota bacterium]
MSAPSENPRKKKKNRLGRLFFWLAVLGGLYVLFLFFRDDLVQLMRRNATVWAVYSHIADQISEKTLLGLAYAGFFGSLFFILIPLEAVFFYYLALEHHAALVILIMLFSSVLGLALDYLMGRLVGEGLLMRYAEERFTKTKRSMDRYGGTIVIVANIIPFLPVQIISVVIGATRFGLRKFLLYTLVGRGAYLVLLWYAADFFKNLLRYLP